MQNKVIQIILVILFLVLGMSTIDYIVALPFLYQIYAGLTAIVVATLIFSAKSLPFDFKLLCLLILGYSLGGKGFAYISPFKPLYIGEIVLIVCLLGFAFRVFSGQKMLPTQIHLVVLAWMVVVGIYLIAGFQEYQLLAIRDSTIAYYGLFFFIAYAIFQSPPSNSAFEKSLKWMTLFGYVSAFSDVTGIYIEHMADLPYMNVLFFPSPDTYCPLLAAGAINGIMQGSSKRSIVLLISGFLGIGLLLMSKTAGLFSFGCCFLALIIFARKIELLIASLFAGTLAAVAFVVLLASGSPIAERILESDQISTVNAVSTSSDFSKSNTTDWRISWWTIVATDTLAKNPLFGSGMGSDISTHFMESVMDIQFGSEEYDNYARYPHNIMFNVFGRMGFVGLAIFIFVFCSFAIFSINFVKNHLTGNQIDSGPLMAFAIFFSGLANSLVQATYETPYAAIIHWVCLGYMVAYHSRSRSSYPVLESMPNRAINLRTTKSALTNA